MEQSFGAVSAVAICASGLMGLPLAVSGLRELKILKRLRVTPVSPVFILGVELSMYNCLLCRVPCDAVCCGAFVGRAAAWFASGFSRKLAAYHALDSVRRYVRTHAQVYVLLRLISTLACEEICHAPTAYGALSWNTNVSKLMSTLPKNQ